MLSQGEFQQKICEVIRTNGSALFSDLELSIGGATHGNQDFILPGKPNSVLWDHVSQDFANALFDLLTTKQIQAELVSVLEYLDEGCLMSLPPATQLQITRSPTGFPSSSRFADARMSTKTFVIESFDATTGIGTARSRVPGEPLFVFGREDLVPEMDGVAFEGELVSAASTDIYGGLCDVVALDLEGDGNEK